MANLPDYDELDDDVYDPDKDLVKGEEYRLYLLNQIYMERDREFRQKARKNHVETNHK